jgi:glutamate dehydrogenase
MVAVERYHTNDDESSAQRLLAEASAVLVERRPDAPRDFLTRLFVNAAPEDLLIYEPAELAALAEESWVNLSDRKPGAPKIRFDPAPPAPGSERLKNVSVVEIVNDDMPFLLDSVMAVLTEQALSIRLVVHPIFSVARASSGKLQELKPEQTGAGGSPRESFIHIHVERIDDEARRTETLRALEQALADVSLAVADWKAVLARVGEVIATVKSDPPPLPAGEVSEAVAFLDWLVANNFTFLGVREYSLTAGGELEPLSGTGLGVLRDRDRPEVMRGKSAELLAREIQAFFNEPKVLLITKANERSRVHRHVFMDYIGVKRFDAAGKAVGEFRIVGLFTSTAYTGSTKSIPYLRRKVDAVLARAGFTPNSHSGKALVNTLESYPRDELFQIDEETLYRFAIAILQLDERPRVRVLARRDRFDRFVSILVYIPRERADSGIVRSIGEFLAEIYKGRSHIPRSRRGFFTSAIRMHSPRATPRAIRRPPRSKTSG